MTVTPEQLHLATQYPYDPPHESFLFVNGRALAMVTTGRDPLIDAQVRIDDRVMTAVEALDVLGASDTPGMAQRTPILSYGSNTSPFGIGRKYQRYYDPGPCVIPAIACDLVDHDVVYSPHFSRWGTIPATIAASPGTVARLVVLYLAPDQLDIMHDIECGPAPARAGNYLFGYLRDVDLRLDGTGALARVPTYVSHYGVLACDGQPVALSAIKSQGRQLPALNGAELLDRIRKDLAADMPQDAFLGKLIADTAYRRACTDRLLAGALGRDVPGFAAEEV